MAQLFLQTQQGEQLAADLGDRIELVIGRSPEADLSISEAGVSNSHLKLTRTEEGWVAEDLNSANGTEINGVAINGQSALLPSEAIMTLGGTVTLRFVDEEEGADSIEVDFPDVEHQESEVGSRKSEVEEAPPAPSAKKIKTPEASKEDVTLVKDMKARTERIRKEVAKIIVGQVEVVDQVLMVLIAGGHGLLVGMPGMAKTTLVATIAKVLDMEFKRVQFTPDLMPTDITGTEILETDPETEKKSFRFIKGPIFTNLLLADEINRTPPKTQAALLEAMQEKCVTVGNQTYTLEPPFFVLATQNPIEQEGTYPLPEAQQDRFMFNLWVDYPKEDEEEQIVKSTTVTSSEKPQKVVTKSELLQLQSVVRKIPVSDHVIKYAIRLVRATRPMDEKCPDFIKKYVQNGAGPRAGQFLVLAAKARAVLEGRIHVSCQDVAKAAIPVLRHRILANFAADSEGISTTALVERLLKDIPQPSEKDYK